jgi:hypothetical protein
LTLLSALRRKCGQESVPSGADNLLDWIYGPEGKLLQRRLTQGDASKMGFQILSRIRNSGKTHGPRSPKGLTRHKTAYRNIPWS